jgi:putative nucleotidyltransferase with HDIG domain
MRGIFSAGLIHGDFSIIEAATPYIAGVKANQYTPDCIIVDITHHDVRDFLLLTRLERCIRTRDIPVIISATAEVQDALHKLRAEASSGPGENGDDHVYVLQYPFHFSVLIHKIHEVVRAHRRVRHKKTSENTTDTGPLVHDGGFLFTSGLTTQEKVGRIERSIRTQWAFPYTVVRAVNIIESDRHGIDKLAQCVESDVAATSAVLRIANTVYYAKTHERTTDLTDAIVRIGFEETRRILESLSLIEIAPHVYSDYGFVRTEFWMHCLACAVIAEKLYSAAGGQRPDRAFVAGLLHDVGKVPLDNNFSGVFPRLLEETTDAIAAFHEIERRLMGFDHADLGGYFVRQWNLPEEIADAVGAHHSIDQVRACDNETARTVSACVYCANLLAKAMGMGHSCDEVLEELPQDILLDCGLTQGPRPSYFNDVLLRLENFLEYLHLSKTDVALHSPLPVQKQTRVYIVYGGETAFHPIECALLHNHYDVTGVSRVPAIEDTTPTVILFMPDKGSPLDITLDASEDATAAQPATVLKIFLLRELSMNDAQKEYNESNVILMDRTRLDLRLLLHVVEDFTYSVTMGQHL